MAEIRGTEAQTRNDEDSASTIAGALIIEEYKTCAQEIKSRSKELGDLERYSIVGIIGYYAWFMTHPSSHEQFPTVLWWVPVAVALFIVARTLIYSHRIDMLSKHITKIEKRCKLVDGYETEMQRLRREKTIWRLSISVGGSTALVWLALLGATIYVAFHHLPVVNNTPGSAG
jgi:hypothetical protein